jgi:sporulation protein YlmC with PRC-barrel domain
MSRTTTIAAFAAILAASPMAFAAQPKAAAPATPPANSSVSETSIQPNQILAGDLKGADVWDSQNKKIGTVKDIVVDKGGRVAAVVLDIDGKNVAVPMHDLQITLEQNSNTPKKVTVNKSQNELKSAQAFQLNEKTAGSQNEAGSGGSAAPAQPGQRK